MTGNSCEFTLRHYHEILEQALAASYQFLCLRDSGRLSSEKRQIILRHDVDFSVEDALRMAGLEREMGIFSTYGVLLHSPTYNIGEINTYRALREILTMGHEIALHYDMLFFEEADISPLGGIEREADFLGGLLGTSIRSVSQHRPFAHGSFSGVGDRYVDAYSPTLTKEILYLSDSRRSWRSGCVHQHLRTADRMQLLIHPEWWESGDARDRRSTVERISKSRQGQILAAMEEYAASMER